MTDAQGHTFDWPRAIASNRDALLRIVAVLFFYAGLDEGGADFVPRRVWRRIVRLLRPAEAAARRLIVAAARGVTVPPLSPLVGEMSPLAATEGGTSISAPRTPLCRSVTSPPQGGRMKPFALTDPPRRFDTLAWDGLRPFPQDGFTLADPDEEVDARHLCRRLCALKRALDDIDGQAHRLARWRARHDAAPLRFKHNRALRPGWPPGHRKRPVHEVDDLLRECHGLALHALKPPDTS